METDTKSLFQITEAAHACGVSRSTLMRMEEKGLLAPVYVAPESGRRYYDNHNIARVLQIEKFKSMGLGAQEIADYFVRGGEVSGPRCWRNACRSFCRVWRSCGCGRGIAAVCRCS